MLGDIQREVAVHLVANALRGRRIAAERRGESSEAAGAFGNRRRSPEDAYLRGMLDLLTALYGRAFADELYREARALENAKPAG